MLLQVQKEMPMNQLIEILKLIFAPTSIIGYITAWIAFQQLQTNRQKLRLDQYERRLRIYEEVKKLIKLVVGEINFTVETLLKFYESTSEADFLFGPEIRAYIEEIFQHANNYRHWRTQYRDSTQPIPAGYDHAQVTEQMNKELIWFSEQLERAKNLFRNYLHAL
jgi:hypothetical protein